MTRRPSVRARGGSGVRRIVGVLTWLFIVGHIPHAVAKTDNHIARPGVEDPRNWRVPLVVFPYDFNVVKLYLSDNKERRDDQEREANEAVDRAVDDALRAHPVAVVKRFNTEISEETATVTMYRGLILALVADILKARRYSVVLHEPAWTEKLNQFDYSIGPGLAQIGTRYGPNAKGVFILGYEEITTGARATASFLSYSNSGASVFIVVVVDLATGNLEWFDFEQQYTSFKFSTEADKIVRPLLDKILPDSFGSQ